MNDSLRPLLLLLEQAEVERNAALAACNQRLQRCQAGQVLNACELRVASVRKLIERRAQMLRQQGERRDQKACDEQAMRVHAQRRSKAAARHGVEMP